MGIGKDQDIAEPDTVWDWIVIGTGMGGSTFGRALAKAGRRVLFIEKGADHRVNPNKKSGNYLESLIPVPAERNAGDYKNAGRSCAKIFDATRGRWIKPMLGCGTGGSSALYGMVLERFWKEDFEPGRWYKDSKSALPDRWPVSFEEMEPFYKEAENLFSVTSLRQDPLRSGQDFAYAPRPPLPPEGTRVSEHLRNQGLHPYTLPLARTWGTPCPFCTSFLCKHDCKNDAAKVCLEPALRNDGASLLSEAEVLEIKAEDSRAIGVTAIVEGRPIFIPAHNVALAAGALFSPVLLLKSRSPRWPDGLANTSGQVGRNLMRHYIDLIGIPSRAPPSEKGDEKGIGCNDFYLRDGEKFGTLADFGAMPPLSAVLEDLDNDVAARGPLQQTLWPLFRPWVRWGLKHILKRYRFMALMTEDLPFPENRVEEGGPGADVTLHYSIRPSEWARIRTARSLVRRALGRWATLLLANANNSKLLAHACGTCRMGDDPATSVVNRYNRAHDVENLYIVDGSFFPSSGGVNPALTIAANAVRVAHHIVETRADAPRARGALPPPDGPPERPRVLFVADAVALSHPARLMEIARQLDSTLYDVHFASDPRYRAVLGQAPFPTHDIESIPSAEFDRVVARGGVFFTEAVIERYVQQEQTLFNTVQPDIVVGEFRPSLGISTRLFRVPSISIVNAYYSPTTRLRHIIPEYIATEWLPRKIAQKLFDFLRLWGYAKHARPINAVRRRHGIPPLLGDLRHTLGDADWTLFPDIEHLFPGRPLSDRQRYMGPISWTPDVPLPPWWDQLPTDRPVIYANLGSSGKNGVLQRVLDALSPLPLTVIAATAGRQTGLVPPANAFLTDFLPGKEAARRSALVITNGGNLSGYQALGEGKLIVGLASNIDQFLNMAAFEDAGVAKLLRARSFTKKELQAAVQFLMTDAKSQQTANRFSAEMAAAPQDVFQSVLEEALKSPRTAGRKKERPNETQA